MHRNKSALFWPLTAVSVAGLLVPLASLAQRCAGNANIGCTHAGAVCSPVTTGVGPTGRCTTPPGFPRGERECECSGQPALNLTGIWSANDGGVYYLRQIGNQLWWAGLSLESPQGVADLQQGISFSNVLQGQLSGTTATGDWADVPRGSILNSGILGLQVSPNHIQRLSATGGFGATAWDRTGPVPPAGVTSIFNNDIFTIFDDVKKNQNAWRDHSLLDNLKPAKSKPVAIFGKLAQTSDPDPMHVNYPISKGRSYNDFICLDDNDSPPDGDIDFDLAVDRPTLDAEHGFWNDDWETSHGITPSNFQNKLNVHSQLHIESIMYGGTKECGDDGAPTFLLPGWQQAGALGVLVNGRPIAGQMDLTERDPNTNRINSILTRPINFGARVRVSGILVLDCGHGILHDCNEDDAGTQNQEIHPVYALDLVQNFLLPRPFALLTGVWSSDDAGTYYVRQVDNTVWWLGLSVDEGRTFANVFRGTLQNGQISGNWADIPLGQTSNAGTLAVTATAGPQSTGLARSSVTGGFGGDSWEKLYDVGGRRLIFQFESASSTGSAWPNTSEPFEFVVAGRRFETRPMNPHSMQSLDGKQTMQVNLGGQVPVDAPQDGSIRIAARFAGYRANWTVAAADLKPGEFTQRMTGPRSIPAAGATARSELSDRDAAEAASRASAAKALSEVTLHYRIVLASDSNQDQPRPSPR